jgi:hypothetical protein
MIVFLDTEFTDLHEPYLLAAGLVSEGGRELYFELPEVKPEICSSFVVQNVLPLLTGQTLNYSDVSDAIVKFFTGYSYSEIVWFCDAPRYDVELLRPFLPPRLRWKVAVPSFETAGEELTYLSEQDKAFAGGLRRHHALDDARAMRYAWQVLYPIRST